MKKTLFQYAVLLHKYDDKNVYQDSQVIIEPKHQLAHTEKELVFKVTREIPAEHTDNPDNVEILIRNF